MQATGLITFVKTTKDHDLSALGGRLKWAREQRKLSQDALAGLAKVSQGTIGNLESGERKSARKLLSIAAALRCSADWLESGRGQWEGGQKGDVFEALTDDERELIAHYRHLLGKDRRTKLKEIAELAAERMAEREELFAQAGLHRISEGAAHAARANTATAVVEPSAALKQRSLPLDK